MQNLQGGRIDYLCEIITTAKPQIDGGTVKGLAILDSKRSPALPNLSTASEQGTDNLIAYTWNAIFLPKSVPEPIVKKLHDAALEAITRPWCVIQVSAHRSCLTMRRRRSISQASLRAKSIMAAPIKASGVSVD